MRRRLLSIIVLCATAALMAACEAKSPDASAHHLVKDAAFSSPSQALETAETLRLAGGGREALAVLRAAHQRFPDNSAVTSAYGRQALMLGEDELARGLLQSAVASNPQDWRALSAQGVMAGRIGQLPDARDAFIRARALSGDAIVLNNLGLSELLDGRATLAASLFRQALASPALNPSHTSRIKRNLAVAVAVEGDFELADRLAGEMLPRSLKNARGKAIAQFMGLPASGSWAARLADASRQFPTPVR